MSVSGHRRLQLEQERKERLRLQQVRETCERVHQACEEALRSVREAEVQQLAAATLGGIVPSLAEARTLTESDPDTALPRLRELHLQVQHAIAEAESEARQWSQRQTEAVAAARAAQLEVVAQVSAREAEREAASAARRSAARALRLAQKGELATAQREQEAALEASHQIAEAVHEERCRREVLRALVESLRELGFVIVGPRLREGTVVLEGRLASGRRARFEVALDGHTHFDLDGYQGRACAEDLEAVEVQLEERFGVKLGPPQVVWKAPEEIKAGARGLPRGGRTRSKGGSR